MGNAVVHFEIGGPDDAPLAAFYGELFGWTLQPFEGGGYTLIDTNGGGGINGGIGKSQTGEPWSTFYVEAADLQAVLDKAESLGGKTVMPVTDFGGAVIIAMFNDPDGLLVGIVKAADPAVDPTAAVGVNQRVAATVEGLQLPAEQFPVESDQRRVVRPADLEVHYCVAH